jgi:hypothetical protein
MAAPNIIQLKRSDVPGKKPLVADLEFGEVALNTYDGSVYAKIDQGTPEVVKIGGPLDQDLIVISELTDITSFEDWGVVTEGVDSQLDFGLITSSATEEIDYISLYSGLLRRTGVNSWVLDTNNYLTVEANTSLILQLQNQLQALSLRVAELEAQLGG